MKRINIITTDSQAGLGRDVKILASILKDAGFSVTVYIIGEKTVGHKIQRIITYINRFTSDTFKSKPPYDINLFLEYVEPSWFSYARVNCLIPNQEWFREDWHPYLKNFDYVLCKTKLAQDIFGKLGCKTEFISFTSLDCFNEKYQKDYDTFLHLASSWQKGTKTILEVWQRHPEWPKLTIKQKQNPRSKITAPNIEYITKYLDDETLCQYQNSHGIHLCPSEAEGFGHYLVEAMSCKAVTLTTNAPPMNELITPNRGILVDYHTTKIQRLGTNYYVDPQSLEQKINEILGMDYNSKKQLGENARDWYQQNDLFFRGKLIGVMENL